MKRHVAFARVVVSALFVAVASVAALADSHVRIVRLSSVEGQVQMDRATGQGNERAILNTPITEGTKLATGNDGLAEVEFENQSALRLTENSEIKFTQMLMNDAGNKINRMTIDRGLVYVDTASKGDDLYLLNIGNQTIQVGRDTLVRISADQDQINLAVLKGEAQLDGGTQPVIIRKKETLTASTKTVSDYTVAKGIDQDRFDKWNEEREDYSREYADNQGYGGPSHAYGLQDLNYYGDFFYASGYGYVWQPYGFASALTGWDPYSNGAWMFYPGMGYAWASAYPWGWLPYHYGSWAYINNTGWAWVPGKYVRQWANNSFQAVPVIAKAPKGYAVPTTPVVSASVKSAPTVLVGKAGGLPLSIPGGRIPPNFGSTVPGRNVTVAGAHGFAKPNALAGSHSTFAAANVGGNNRGYNGHVFAEPVSRSVFADETGIHSAYGGSRAGGVAISASHSGSGTSSGVASSGGGSHK